MSRKLLSLAVIAAAFTLILGASEAQARSHWSHNRNHGCCQINNCGYQPAVNVGYGNCGYRNRGFGNRGFGNCGYQQTTYCGYQQTMHVRYVNRGYRNCSYSNCDNQQAANYGCQQTSYVTATAICNPRPTCCNVRPACAAFVSPASASAPQPPVEQTLAPTPGF